MARVRILQNEEAPAKSKAFLEKIEENGAAVLNLYRTLAHSPSTLTNTVKLGKVLLDQAELSPQLREMVILRIAILLGSQYEWNQHVPIALGAGVTQQQIDSIHIWPESEHFDKKERAVLRYADQVTLNIRATDRAFGTLHRYLSERSIVELTASIGYWGMIARLLEPLEVEMDEFAAGSAERLYGGKRD